MKTIKECVTITNEKNGTKQLIALYTDESIEEVGYPVYESDSLECLISKFVGLTDFTARRLFAARF